MRKKASKPMSGSATRKADELFYANHPEMVVNGVKQPIPQISQEPAHQLMRNEWMQAYENAGGKVEVVTEESQKKQNQTANDDANSCFSDSPAGAPVNSCPNSSSNIAVCEEQQAAATDDKDAKCELQSLSVVDEVGRNAKDNVLMVVPKKLAKKISVTSSVKSPCAHHPVTKVNGFWTSTFNGGSAEFSAQAWWPKPSGWLSMRSVSPHVYNITSPACKGNVPAVRVEAYPSEELSYKIDGTKIFDKIRSYMKNIPIPASELKKWEKKWFQGAIEFKSMWEEDSSSHRAFCTMTTSGGFDPLIGAEYKIGVWPMSGIPERVLKYVKAGVFLTFTGGGKVEIDVQGKYWPDTKEEEFSKARLTLGGSFDVELSLEAHLLSEDVISAKVSGKTGIMLEGSGIYKKSAIYGNYRFGWAGLDGIFSISAAWGWISYNKKCNIIKERVWDFDQDSWLFDI